MTESTPAWLLSFCANTFEFTDCKVGNKCVSLKDNTVQVRYAFIFREQSDGDLHTNETTLYEQGEICPSVP